MRKAIVENGVVVNVIIAPDDWKPETGECVDAPNDKVEIGFVRQKDGSFINPNAPKPPTIEDRREDASLSRVDFMLALDKAGLLDEIESKVPTMPRRAQIVWHNASTFERTSPDVLQIASEMKLSDEALDEVFGIKLNEALGHEQDKNREG